MTYGSLRILLVCVLVALYGFSGCSYPAPVDSLLHSAAPEGPGRWEPDAKAGGKQDPAAVHPPAHPSGPLTLEACIERALAANPGLRAGDQASRAARMEARAAALTRLGRVESIVSYTKYDDDRLIRPMSRKLLSGGMGGLPFDDEQILYGVAYELPLYLGGRLGARTRVARLAAQRASALLEGNRWQVRFNATSLFVGAVALDSAETALSELERSLDQTRKRLDLMVSQGKRPEIDRLKILDQVAEVRQQQARVGASRVRVRGLLAALLGTSDVD